MDNLERQLDLAYRGKISGNVFVRSTRRDFVHMAAYLLRRWSAPAWYVLDDVVQELLIGAWTTMWDWSAAMGPSLKRFTVFGAISLAKRELHRARSAKLSGSPDRNPSRFERTLSSYGEAGDGEAMAEARLAQHGPGWAGAGDGFADAEAYLIAREEAAEGVRDAIAACETETERAVILAIAKAGGVAEGALAVYNDIDARIRLRLVSEEHAERVVARKARAVFRRECRAAS